MPPKKKKGTKSGKGKRKKSGRKSASKGIESAVEIISELTKEFYLIQIRDLEARLSRYQKKCDELELENKEFKNNYDQQAMDKKEIVSFLKKQLEQRADEIADLQERLIGLQQAKDSEKDQYEVQLATLRTEMQEIKDQLTSENMVLGGKLASLEEFRVQREDLMAKFANLEQQLIDQENQYKEQIYSLEKKAVVDKDRLKKEMIVRVNTVAAEFRKVSNKQMAETTKRTLRENVAINAQLGKMSDKTMELIQENDELRAKEKKQKQQIELLEHNEKDLIKKNASNQKVIRMLTEKAKTQEELLTEFKEKEIRFKELEEEFDNVKEQMSLLEAKAMGAEKENEALLEKIKLNEEKNAKVVKERKKITDILVECAKTINSSLQLTDDKNPAASELLRKATLERIVDILDLAVGEGYGTNFKDVKTKNATKPSAKSTYYSLYGRKSKSIAHYQLGDLGIVPPMPPTTSDPFERGRTRAVSTQTLGLQKGKSGLDALLLKQTSKKIPSIHHHYSNIERTKLPAL